MKNLFYIIFSVLIIICFFGCATTIPVQIERPAELDLGGAKSIAVLPISTQSTQLGLDSTVGTIIIVGSLDDLQQENQDEVVCANYITTALTNRLSNSSYLTLVGAEAVNVALKNGQEVPCDAYLTGKISEFKEEKLQKDTIEEIDGIESVVTQFSRSVSFTVTYQVVDASTNIIISQKSANISASSSPVISMDKIPTVLDTIRLEIDAFAGTVMKQLQPYTITKNIVLLSDKTKDIAMEEAHNFAKGGSIERAKEMFLTSYTNSKYFEAGYNAAMLMQVLGELNEAKGLMQELVYNYGDSRATKALNDINNEIASAEKLYSQIIESQ